MFDENDILYNMLAKIYEENDDNCTCLMKMTLFITCWQGCIYENNDDCSNDTYQINNEFNSTIKVYHI